MPKLRPGQAPSLRRHRPSGRAVVTLSGKDHYLGPWPPEDKLPPADVAEKYHRLVAEWMANGQQCPPATPASAAEPHPGITVGELILRFWRHAERHYRLPNGSQSTELANFKLAIRPLRQLYESLPATDFSPMKLKAVRQEMIAAGLNRRVINHRVGRIVRMFRWAVAEELVPVTTHQALKTLPGL